MPDRQLTSSVKRIIKGDARYKKFKEAFESSGYYALDVIELEKEILFLHETRVIRKMRDFRGSPNYVDNVIEAVMMDQSIRSRLTEILVACITVESRLKDGLKKLTDYISVEYSTELSKWRTKDERKTFVETILRNPYSYREKVEVLRMKIEIIVTDIDKAGFALKNTIQALELVVKPEKRI